MKMKQSPDVVPTATAFTLIELLVVISIIAVLAGILLPVTSSVMNNARKTQAKSTEVQIVTAIKSYQTDYGVYPLPADAPINTDVCFGSNAPTQAELFHILRADSQVDGGTINPRRIVYIELPNAKNMAKGQAKSGIGSDGMLYDPWGTIFFVGIDGNYDDTVNNPYGKNAGSNPLRTAIIVYSWGPDKLTTSNFYGGGDKNDATSKDDVISWQ